MAQYRPITVIRWAFLFGLFFVLPVGLNPLLAAPWADFPAKIWGEIAFVLLGTTYLAYLLNMFALKQVSSTTVSFYIYLQPVFATLAAVWLGSDTLTWLATGAALLIFAGVYLVSRPAR
jgi:drug/metabolite transporter (DMT)-like permease